MGLAEVVIMPGALHGGQCVLVMMQVKASLVISS